MDWTIYFKFLYAAVLGGLIGMERQFARKPAGLRTHVLVAGTASLLFSLADVWPEHDRFRLVQALIAGISFLGAGTIIRGPSNNVKGLTTAASLLFAAVTGLYASSGLYLTAAVAALTAVAILRPLGLAEPSADEGAEP